MLWLFYCYMCIKLKSLFNKIKYLFNKIKSYIVYIEFCSYICI